MTAPREPWMVRIYRYESPTIMCECNNCDWIGPEAELGCTLWECSHLSERIAPGEIVPVGECPKCGALASIFEPEDDAPPKTVTIGIHSRDGDKYDEENGMT